jgi:hypothetical protein
MNADQTPQLETDPRFPTGPWTGYFLQKAIPGKHTMELHLVFTNGIMKGEGRDWVGEFLIDGHYDISNGKCYWTKKYVGKHDVFYQGFNEGKGIWGTWEIPGQMLTLWRRLHGGFHIWPEGLGNPSDDALSAEAEPPLESEELVETGIMASGKDLP